jgi:hypothetical protein
MNYCWKTPGPETGYYHCVPLSVKLSALLIPVSALPSAPQYLASTFVLNTLMGTHGNGDHAHEHSPEYS